MTLILNADTVNFILTDAGKAAVHFRATPRAEVCISALTLGELRRGVALRRSRRIATTVDTFLSAIAVMPFGAEESEQFGKLSAALSRQGVPMGVLDASIAAHALTLRAAVVTHDRRYFDRVRGLRVVDWHG